MAAPIRYKSDAGRTLAVAVERLSDHTLYDFSTSGFVAGPATLTAALAEWTPTFPGVYWKTISPTPVAAWPDADYMAIVVDSTTGLPVDLLPFQMRNGDAYAVGGLDPHQDAVAVGPIVKNPAGYAPGSIGWCDRGTSALRVVAVPDGNGGYQLSYL